MGGSGGARTGRRGAIVGLLAAWLATDCGRDHLEGLRPSTVEGPPRTYLVVEVVRRARTAAGTSPSVIEACRWHVNPDGAFYGDHWGWCEDFTILPRSSPGYLVATTLYSGGTTGGYSRLVVLPPLPAVVEVFQRTWHLSEAGGEVRVELAGMAMNLPARRAVDLGGESGALVEPPPDTGHFETGGDRPVLADVTYGAISYGHLDSRKIAGRT